MKQGASRITRRPVPVWIITIYHFLLGLVLILVYMGSVLFPMDNEFLNNAHKQYMENISNTEEVFALLTTLIWFWGVYDLFKLRSEAYIALIIGFVLGAGLSIYQGSVHGVRQFIEFGHGGVLSLLISAGIELMVIGYAIWFAQKQRYELENT